MSERQIDLTPAEVALRIEERRLKAKRERQAEIVQTALGSAATLAGLVIGTFVALSKDPSYVSAFMAAGAFMTGIMVAVPAARPWVIRFIERLPWTKDLPDDWEGE